MVSIFASSKESWISRVQPLSAVGIRIRLSGGGMMRSFFTWERHCILEARSRYAAGWTNVGVGGVVDGRLGRSAGWSAVRIITTRVCRAADEQV
jgi:hypothetical protein